jgi:hypothetical protein
MAVIERTRVIEGVGMGGALSNAGAPSNGTDEVQTLTFGGTPDGGTFRLALGGTLITAAITWSATNATLVANIDAALEAILGSGSVTTAVDTMTAGIGTITVTFTGAYGKIAVPILTVYDNSLTGTSPTLGVTETTPGVSATGRGAPKGAKLIDTTNGVDYLNTGTPNAPTWTKTGTQS